MSELNNNTQESIDDGIPEVTFTVETSSVVQAPIDPTLSIEGMAADAKATGDAIAQARSDLTETIETADTALQAAIDLVDTTLQASIESTRATLQAEIDAIETGVDSVAGQLFPVGCIYVSVSSTAPTFGGNTWVWEEILIPATWGDLEDGARSYKTKESGDTPGTLHFWRRTA